jgi:hypothetical protein
VVDGNEEWVEGSRGLAIDEEGCDFRNVLALVREKVD